MPTRTSVSQEEVQHMAALSRLCVSSDEQIKFAKQFADILSYMDILQDINVTGVEPLYSPVSHNEIVRKDNPFNKSSREDILQNAPDSDGEYFIVPRIV